MIRVALVILTFAGLVGCGAATKSIEYVSTDYSNAAPSVDVTVDSSDGPQVLKVRRHPTLPKVLVLLDSGALKRALAKDLGATDNALPQTTFEEAANRRIAETEGPQCRAGLAVKRQDYLWEFNISCGPTPAPNRRKG